MSNTVAKLLILATCLVLPSLAAAENPNDILIVVNPSVKVSSITLEEVKDLFLKKRTSWGSSGKVTPINASGGSALKAEFVSKVLGMSVVEERRFWQDRKIKTGDGEPTSFSNTLKAVYKVRGSISYVYRSQYKEGVAKVLLVIPAG